MNVSVPSQRSPKYAIENGVRCGPVNALGTLNEPADGYTVIGAGKTGGVVPHPDAATDWIRTAYGNSLTSARWNADVELAAWLASARLDGFSSAEPPSDELVTVMLGALEHAEPALAKLEQYVAELDAAPTGA